jgi:formylglycine-generating enzyme required for sulfatase activity
MSHLKIIFLVLFTSQSICALAAGEWVDPPMVDIPAGQLKAKITTEIKKGPSVVDPNAKYKTLNINAFRLSKYEVTTKEFGLFIADTNYQTPTSCHQMDKNWFTFRAGSWNKHELLSSDYEPVTCINWDAAQAYVKWLSKKTGKPYRLPSEAEWEYAARAGSTTLYYWGDDAAQACRYANIADQAAEAAVKRDYNGLESKDHVGVIPCNDNSGYASVVGLYEPNQFGLYDMIGNISEFTLDCFDLGFPGSATDGSPRLGGDCGRHMFRNGSWHGVPQDASSRGGWYEESVGTLEGFRIAEDVTGEQSDRKWFGKKKTKATRKFERDLAKAQQAARKKI